MRLLTDMPSSLLREYVNLLIEKIRTEKGVKSKLGEKFNLNRFKQIQTAEQMMTYANHFLEVLGEGSARRAFLLSSKYVLKIARNKKGIAQNEAEVDVYTNPKSKPVVAKVYSSDPEYMWVIADVVQPLHEPDEFDKLTGTNWDDFINALMEGLSGRNPGAMDEFTASVLYTAKQNNLMFGDIEEIGHWGKTPDGRCVLLDYGFTREVWTSHYAKKQEPTPPKPQDAKTSVNKGNATDTVQDPVNPHARTAIDSNGMPAVAKTVNADDERNAKTTAPNKKARPRSDNPQDAKTAAPPKKRLA